MMKFKTFAKNWLIDELESRDIYPYLNRLTALHCVVGSYRNFFSRIHRATFKDLLEVVVILRNEPESEVLASIQNDYDLYRSCF